MRVCFLYIAILFSFGSHVQVTLSSLPRMPDRKTKRYYIIHLPDVFIHHSPVILSNFFLVYTAVLVKRVR